MQSKKSYLQEKKNQDHIWMAYLVQYSLHHRITHRKAGFEKKKLPCYMSMNMSYGRELILHLKIFLGLHFEIHFFLSFISS